MYRYFAFSLAVAATTVAQIPTNLTFRQLTTQYLPFVSINTDYIFNDTRASRQLANAVNDPVTIFLSLNTAFEQFLATPPPSVAAAQIETDSSTNANVNSDLFQYLQLSGVHLSATFNGTSFMRTRFQDDRYEAVIGGQNIEVFRNESAFFVGTGIGFKSNVVIPDLKFAGGVIHIVDHPMAPPYTIANTGTVLGINALNRISDEPNLKPYFPSNETAHGYNLHSSQNVFDLNSFPNVTVFAIQNSALNQTSIASPQVAANYVYHGPVLYSTALTAGTSFLTVGNSKLFVTTNASGAIFVNESRIVEPDILTSNGVVHVIESPLSAIAPATSSK